MIESVAVFGLGRVGSLVALLLQEQGVRVTGYDLAPRTDLGLPVRTADAVRAGSVDAALEGVDAVVSCLPHQLNLLVARRAARLRVHYFDLTEDVGTATEVARLADRVPGVLFAPQCGLAPGFICMVGAWLIGQLDPADDVELKVGALPAFPDGRLGYAFTWSAEGVINEYLKDCEILQDHELRRVPGLTDVSRVVIGGVELEAAHTSGGLGSMCHTYRGRVGGLRYKTLRYPGHFESMRFLLDELGLRDHPDELARLLQGANPPVHEDVVYLHASARGRPAAAEGPGAGPGRLEFVQTYRPRELFGRRWTAISWTTASSAAAVVELVRAGQLPAEGLLRQEDVALRAVLATDAGASLGAGVSVA